MSEAYASIPGDRVYEIGAIVHPEFRRRGLAYATCAALIDECRRRDYETVWSCHRATKTRHSWRGGSGISASDRTGSGSRGGHDRHIVTPVGRGFEMREPGS